MATVRDEFYAPIKRSLAARVSYFCSNPDCRRSTIGPGIKENTIVNLGVAAHITAASPGTANNPGPRYDKNLSPEERSSAFNGIHLCQNCAKLIDSDVSFFTVDVLRKWKQDAVEYALKARVSGIVMQPGKMIFELDEASKEFLQGLLLPADDDIESVTTRMKKAALKDITNFRSIREWPRYVIPLNLTLQTSNEKFGITLKNVANIANVAESLHLISPPGTGKTTTLVQLTDNILNAGQAVPVFVPLGEWSVRSEDFFEFLIRRNSFCNFRPQHFMQMAYHGRLVLLLDGWNELDPASRIRAEYDLKALRRDFSLISIIISTRRQAHLISGPTVEIEALSEDQQLELAQELRGEEGKSLIDQAWRIPGVRELISIPLYFNALLTTVSGASLPKTKEELLSTFIIEHEKAPEKIEILRREELLDFHKNMLIGLAVEANRSSNTTLSAEKARCVISDIVKQLQDAGQITVLLQPNKVLDTLVNIHALVRSPAGDGSISFQHQQFQEWYASFEVESLMVKAVQDSDSKKALRVNILNWPSWEESILFACERLSRKNLDGAIAVAKAIIEALTICPMLAADMIYRSAPEVWPSIKDKVIDFTNKWHKSGEVDRASRFMITSGRPEFSDHIWQLIESADNNTYLSALRTAKRFRPSVLGANPENRLANMPEETRCHVVAEIGQRSGFDGIELATKIAKKDLSPRVAFEVIQSLQFRRAERHVKEILQIAPDEVWKLLIHRGYRVSEFSDSSIKEKLLKTQKEIIENETDPAKLIGCLADYKIEGIDVEARIIQLISSPDFPSQHEHAGTIISRIYENYPQAIEKAFLQRIVDKLDVPYCAQEFLKNAPSTENDLVLNKALDLSASRHTANAAFSILGSKSVGQVMDKLFIMEDSLQNKKLDEAGRKEYYHLKDGITISKPESFFAALIERSESINLHRIKLMADLLAQHGRNSHREPLTVSNDIGKQLSIILKRWITTLLNSPESNRHQRVYVVNAIERLAKPEFLDDLQKMLKCDLLEQALEKKGRPYSTDGASCYMLQYQRAFSSIGDDNVVILMKNYLLELEFGIEAASILLDIWSQNYPPNKEQKSFSGPDFSNVKERRLRLLDIQNPPETHDFSETIFEVVKKLGITENKDIEQKHAIALAKIALNMPHGIKSSELKTLFKLPQAYTIKLGLFTAAARAGEVIPAEMLIAGIQELLEVAKTQSWRLNDNSGELIRWIELFAFSDQPLEVLKAIDLLPQQHREYWRLKRLLSSLGDSPHKDAMLVLEKLAQNDSRFLKEYEWLDAIMRLKTENSAYLLLNLIYDDQLIENGGGSSAWKLREHISNLAEKFPSVRDNILQRYEQMPNGKSKRIIESIIIELADKSIILTLINNYASTNRSFDRALYQAISQVAVEKRPIEGRNGAYEQYRVSLPDLKKQLFQIVIANDSRSTIACTCLTEIDKIRDEYGFISDEPRHPDIDSEQPWPIV